MGAVPVPNRPRTPESINSLFSHHLIRAGLCVSANALAEKLEIADSPALLKSELNFAQFRQL